MSVTTRPLAGNHHFRGEFVPADRLAKTFRWTQLHGQGQLIGGNWTPQRLYIEHQTPAHHKQHLLEPLQRRRLNPSLDPADRVLAGSRPNGERSLAQSLGTPNLTEHLAKVLTPHKVSE